MLHCPIIGDKQYGTQEYAPSIDKSYICILMK